MPVKTILVDEPTHTRLLSHKHPGETKEATINRLLDILEAKKKVKG